MRVVSNQSTDLVVRIREHEGAYLFPKTADALLKEAADEIERLRGRNARGDVMTALKETP
jgi:hypothetical protein